MIVYMLELKNSTLKQKRLKKTSFAVPGMLKVHLLTREIYKPKMEWKPPSTRMC
jgi:hypothetical protein